MKKRIIAIFLSGLMFGNLILQNKSFNKNAYADNQEVYFSDMDASINNGEPIRGVDISSIVSIENAGVQFYNDYGKEQDIFKTLAEHGVNYIRVRVWNHPYDLEGNSYGGGNCDAYIAGIIGKRASAYGIKLLVDLQYSDFWADPEKQTKPKEWKNFDYEETKIAIYNYTRDTLKYIQENGGDIGMVQIGNETNCFFCGETDMYKICDMFKSGCKAVRDFDSSILIALHFANPSTGYYDWYAKTLDECWVDYDIFTTSYYPYWHGTTENLTKVLKSIADQYNKYVMVAETAYPYTDEDGDTFGNVVSSSSDHAELRYPVSVEGQTACLTDVFRAIANVGSKGIGVFYWEPAWLGVAHISWQNQRELWEKYGSGWATSTASEYDASVTTSGGSSYDNQALFDFNGKPLSSLDVFTRIYPQNAIVIPKEGSNITEGVYRIKNVNSGKYLTVEEGNSASGTNVFQFSADGVADYNSWKITATKDGYYHIWSGIEDYQTYLLDINNGNNQNNTNIQIYKETNSDAQEFKFIQNSDGSYIIVTKNSKDSSAVEIIDGKTEDGGNAQQYQINGFDCQNWILEPVEEMYVLGDFNQNGYVDAFDLALLKKSIFSNKTNQYSDINEDGNTSIADVILIQKYLINKSDYKPIYRGTPRNSIFPKKQ